MAFWWRRRRKPWFARWKRRSYRKRWPRRRRKPRYYKRRRTRRTYKRRRTRRTKVRRKKQKIPLFQWQPDSINKCHIKGHSALIIGCEGKQMDCYTTEKNVYVPPKVPYGGAFAVEKYTLQYLYEEYIFQNNIWTKTNFYKDLCRYLYVRFTFFRHAETDFVVNYNRQPPFDLNKWTYPGTHPHILLLQKHKKVILSTASKPNGRYKTKMLVKPPKQMLTKWFFTKEFSKYPLLLLQASALNLRYSFLSASNENMQVNIASLNPYFYQNTDWAQKKMDTKGYLPVTGLSKGLQYTVKLKTGAEEDKTMPNAAWDTYNGSVNYSTGWFNPNFLRSIKLKWSGQQVALYAMVYGRYNPVIDNGKGNKIYIISTIADHWGPPTHDKMVLLEDVPLWLGVWGYISYLKTVKPEDWLLTSLIVLESKAIKCYNMIGACTTWAPIDKEYMDGTKPYDQVVTTQDKERWYPNYKWQLKTLNAIAECGPFVPQYSEEKYSTWELKIGYDFCFKWGGPAVPEQDVKNPQELKVYDVPDKQFGRIQITNPAKQATETIFHPWDYRRGFIKEKALKRMCQHLETDTEFALSSEEDTPPEKKRKGAALQNPQEETQEIQSCLRYLCEENTCQEQTDNLKQLIQHQQQQQQQLKYSILKLLFDLKEKQKILQMQTGVLE
nr:MAG: ORF1 [Torque teno midi virus]